MKIRPRDNDSFSSFHSLASGASERKKKSGLFSSIRSSSSLSERSSSALMQTSSRSLPNEDCSTSTPSHISKEYLIKTSRSSKQPRYVMKSVQDEAKNESKETYLKGCIDLALEAKYLSSLSHPSILDVRGVASCGPFKEGYFIILDRLPEMLPKRLNRWMTVDRQTKGVTGILTGGKNKADGLLVERFVVAHDIASALGYLHELRVVYRDLVCLLLLYSNSKMKARHLYSHSCPLHSLYRNPIILALIGVVGPNCLILACQKNSMKTSGPRVACIA